MLFAVTILIHFCGTLIVCNEDILICHTELKQLKKDVKNWEKRCVNESLKNFDEIQRYFNEYKLSSHEIQEYFKESRGESNSSGCMAEKEYLQDRMRMHSKMCFYEGKFIDFPLLGLGVYIFLIHFQKWPWWQSDQPPNYIAELKIRARNILFDL